MGRPKGAKNKPKQAHIEFVGAAQEIPIAVYDWLGTKSGFHCLVILQTPDGKAFSVELYVTPASQADSIVGTGQDEVLREAFAKAIANYNLQANVLGKPQIV